MERNTEQPARFCDVCGRALPPPSVRGGRPALRHAGPCRRIADALSSIGSAFADPEFEVTPERYKTLRRDLWSAANLLNDRLTTRKGREPVA